MTAIPFLDLRAGYLELQKEIDDAVLKSLNSGWYILGDEVEAFEAEYASYCGAAHCVSVANGLDALTLSLRALGIGYGDEVLVPSNTFIATWLAVSAVGGRPVPVEPDPQTHNLNPDKLAAAITSKTRAIIPVHLYGYPAELDAILTLAKEREISVVEDAAQAHGAFYKQRRIGSHSDMVCWSFYPGKNLGAMGDGGAITTNDANLAERLRLLRNYGSREKYVNEVKGVNSRLDPLQAAVLRVKLRHLDEWNKRRAQIAGHFNTVLANTPLTLPPVNDCCHSSWHLYVVQSEERAKLQAYLTECRIGNLIHYPIPPHLQQAFSAEGYKKGDFPIAETLASRVLSLPIGPQQSIDQTERIAATIRAFF